MAYKLIKVYEIVINHTLTASKQFVVTQTRNVLTNLNLNLKF